MTLEGQSQGDSDFEAVRLVKEASLGHMLVCPLCPMQWSGFDR